jgi:uncharacterized membrane protein
MPNLFLLVGNRFKELASLTPFFSFSLLAITAIALGAGFPAWPTPLLGNFRNLFIALTLVGSLLTIFTTKGRKVWRTFVSEPETLMSPLNAQRGIKAILVFHFLIFIKICVLNYYSFNVNATDFSIFDYMIPNTARGHFMQSMTGLNHFGVHSTPLLFLLYPFHRLCNHPLFFVVLHAVVLASSGIPLALIAKNRLRAGIHQVMILIAFYHFGFVGQLLQYNFHIEVFYVPLFFWFLYFTDRRQFNRAFFVALFIFSIKEDAAIYLAATALAGAVTRMKFPRWFSIALGSISAGVLVTNLGWVIPHNSAHSVFVLPNAASSEGTILATVKYLVQNWRETLVRLLTGQALRINFPFLFLPLTQPFVLISVAPFVFIHATAHALIMRNLMLYYSAPYLPFLFFGYLISLTESRPKSLALLITLALTTLVGGGYLQFQKVDPEYGQFLNLKRAVNETRTLCVQGSLAPHFRYPPQINLLTPGCFNSAKDYYVLNPRLSRYPLDDSEYDRLQKRLQTDPNYRETAFGSFLLFTRINPPNS